MKFVILLFIIFISQVASTCVPRNGTDHTQCRRYARRCKQEQYQWVGVGCVINKVRMRDGGCRLLSPTESHYCGFTCERRCNKFPTTCTWKNGTCTHIVTAEYDPPNEY